MRFLAALSLALPALGPGTAAAQAPSPRAIDIPPWFAETLLDFRDDVRDAAKDGKRVMLYFGQDGCPYCKRLMEVNFRQQRIVDKTRKQLRRDRAQHLGRPRSHLDRRPRDEREGARRARSRCSSRRPCFSSTRGRRRAARERLPTRRDRFDAALDYVVGEDGGEAAVRRLPAAPCKPTRRRQPQSAEPFFMQPPYDLRRKPGAQAAGGAVRDAALHRLRRAARRRLHARGSRSPARAVRRRAAFHSLRANAS